MVGYCEPFSVLPGERIELFFSVEPQDEGVPLTLDIVRLRCGELHTGLDESVVEVEDLASDLIGRHQALRPGSYAVVEADVALRQLRDLRVSVIVKPSAADAGREQAIISATGFSLVVDGTGAPCFRVGETEVTTGLALRRNSWVRLTASYDAATGELAVHQHALPTRSPADVLLNRSADATVIGPALALRADGPLVFAARTAAGGVLFEAHFDGRIEAPTVEGIGAWDFSDGIGTTTVIDTSAAGHHGQTYQTPARAVTGSTWDGATQRWADDPTQYGAIHFHHDDLTNAEWEPDAALTVPADLRSGIYCFRVTNPVTGEVDRTPFVVRAPAGKPSSKVLFLVPTATYLAYANHRMTIDGSDFFPARNRLRPEFEYVATHPEVGYSMYESHPDGSGVMYSSRRRPVLNLKPGADGWAFTADTVIVQFLERAGLGYDVLTDEDLHDMGPSALAPYNVVVTGTHPEYFSTVMLDAVEEYLKDGGRLMYLGGNGFYWRVAFSPEEPGVMEVRRAEDGTRGWIAEPGEYHHAWGGEYGGLWRRLGRAPNLLVGVGFAAQGFDRAAPFKRTPESFEGRAAWIFDGVEAAEVVGDYGIGRGAAGQEIDRFDERLGSPPHAVILAFADEHSEQMLRTKEELFATRLNGPDPKIRADVVFFETPAGGAVFSASSIAWFGALPHNGWSNDITAITTNVLLRFADPEPFPLPSV